MKLIYPVIFGILLLLLGGCSTGREVNQIINEFYFPEDGKNEEAPQFGDPSPFAQEVQNQAELVNPINATPKSDNPFNL